MAFLIRALPTLLSLSLPLAELPDVNSLGAMPIYATTFLTLAHLTNSDSSERIAAIVASPTPGIDRRRSDFAFTFGSLFIILAISS